MTHLEVVLRGPAGAIAWRTIPLREGVVLGDAPGAEVAFPGAVLVLRRDRLGWTLDGHRLLVDKPLVFGFTGFEVRIAPTAEIVGGADVRLGLDPRLVIAVAALLLLGGSLSAAERVAADHPELTERLVAAVLGTSVPDRAPAAEASVELRADREAPE
ncbi:MAG TPA: hypothetical protein PKA64_12170 [Myxococcota bacterium]|nr:hypothetical protein [Myxococcota bacterium]